MMCLCCSKQLHVLARLNYENPSHPVADQETEARLGPAKQ